MRGERCIREEGTGEEIIYDKADIGIVPSDLKWKWTMKVQTNHSLDFMAVV